MAIPKRIHHCWLSGEKMPENIVKCINTWENIMPDYEIVLWDKNRFDINSVLSVAVNTQKGGREVHP
jgi:mannosyltransferase OCH1-like enzyme